MKQQFKELAKELATTFCQEVLHTHKASIIKFTTNITMLLLFLAAIIVTYLLIKITIFLIFQLPQLLRAKKYRIADLDNFSILLRRLNTQKLKEGKKGYDIILPKVYRNKNELILKNISPATTKKSLQDNQCTLELLFENSIADYELYQTSFFGIFSKKTCLKITFGKLPTRYNFEQIKNKNRFEVVLGMTATSIERTWDLTKKSTGMVLGAMGSGKSVLLAAIVTQLLHKQFKVKVILATGKEPLEDFPQFQNHQDVTLLCHQTKDGYSRLTSEIESLLSEDKPRMSELFKKHNCKKWFELPSPELKVIIIDEAFTISSNETWKQDSKKLNDLISLGRSYGHFVIVGTQGQRADEFKKIGIDPDRFLFKVGSKVSTPQLSQTLYNSQEIGIDDTLTQGKMLYTEGGKAEAIRAVYADHITVFPKKSHHTEIQKEIEVTTVETIEIKPPEIIPPQKSEAQHIQNKPSKLDRFKRKAL